MGSFWINSSSFSQGRSKRHADAAPRVEDYMDEEEGSAEEGWLWIYPMDPF